MKKFCHLLFLFIMMHTLQAQIKLDQHSNSTDIKLDNVVRLSNGIGLVDSNATGSVDGSIKYSVVLLTLILHDTITANSSAGIFFDNIPGLKQGIAIWRYKPWNSWTKPIAVTDATKMQDWDVQFFYWQYSDGLYGAAVPLSGNGFRTTLGSEANKWGSKAISYAPNKNLTKVPAMAIAFGKDPYEVFSRIYRTALEAMGKGENHFAKKTLPAPLQYIGWCTWNASNLGRDLNEEHIIEGVKTFTDKGFPLGWVLVDDGWFQHQHSQLQSLQPDPKKFPQGFRPMIQKLKTELGVKYAGVWHAFNGYWNGIDPTSQLGLQYKNDLFSWQQKESIGNESSPVKMYSFLKPGSKGLTEFFDNWHQYLRGEGFDFIKVDNQLVSERMAANNYPLFDLSASIHKALYKSVNKHFSGAIINCMDMTADAYLNFGSSAVARAVEDFFPYEKGEGYDLQHGNAAAHVLQAVYNSLYFSQMVFPDFDMFQSNHPNAVMHALARTLKNGPIYLTDKPGEQDFDLLSRLVFSDGRSIRSETALLPARDCLFQVQEAKLFKAFSKVRSTGLLALFNLADADKVEGSFSAADVEGLEGNDFVLYDYFSGHAQRVSKEKITALSLPRMGYNLQYVVPVKNDFAPFGLVNKFNAPATILQEAWKGNAVSILLYEGGSFKAYSKSKPKKLLVNKIETNFSYNDQLINVNVPVAEKKSEVEVIF